MLKQNIAAHGLSGWIIALLNEIVRRLLQPASRSVMLALAADLSRSKADLIAENALLRQQLAILKRQIKRPRLTTADRLRLLFMARVTKTWRQALLIVQPDTLLRWHRVDLTIAHGAEKR